MAKEKLWTRDYILLLVTASFQNLQIQLVNPIMARYSRDTGIGLGTAGVIVGSFSLAALLSRPMGGSLSDKLSNRGLAAVSALAMGLATLGYELCGGRISLLLAFRFLHGLAFGFCGTTLMRMASAVIPLSRMGQGMGYFGLGQVLSIAAAPGIGLFLADRFGYFYTFRISAAAIGAVALLCLFIRLPPQKEAEKGVPAASGWRRLVAPEALGLSLVAAALFFANSVESNFVILYGESLSLGHLGLYFTVGAAAMLAVRLFAGQILDKKGLPFVLTPALLCVAAAMVLLACAPLIPAAGLFALFLAAAVLRALGHAAAQPSLQAACVRAVPPRRRGLASGTFYMGCDIGMGLGPLAGGLIVGGAGYPALYLSAGAVTLLGLGAFLFFRNARRAH